jgi:hypothetical protein
MSYTNLTVTNLLTLGNQLKIEVPNWDDIIIYGVQGMQTGDDPVLYLSNASLWADNDVLVYGFISSVTDPVKSTGGGAIMIGHGWTATTDYPAIVITDYPGSTSYDTLWLKHSAASTPSDLSPLPWGNLELGDLIVHGAIKSYNNGIWLRSYYGGGGGGNNGGIAIDNYGNVRFQGGDAGNSWHVFNSYGYDLFNIKNNLSGATYGVIDIHLNPYQDRTWALGSPSLRWAGLCAWDIYFANHYDQWDSIDDLSYAKQFKGKTITDAQGKQHTIIDPDTTQIFKVDYDPNNIDHHNKNNVEEMHDLHKVIGFMLCCHKASALKLDEHEANFAEVAKLKEDVAGLRAQIQVLTGKTGHSRTTDMGR